MKCKVCKFNLINEEYICPICNNTCCEKVNSISDINKINRFVSYIENKSSAKEKQFEVLTISLFVILLVLFSIYTLLGPVLNSATTKVFKDWENFLWYNLTFTFALGIILMIGAFFTFKEEKTEKKTCKKYFVFEILDLYIYSMYFLCYVLKYIFFINPVMTEVFTKFPKNIVSDRYMRIICIYRILYLASCVLHMLMFIIVKNSNINFPYQYKILLKKSLFEKEIYFNKKKIV